MVYLKIYKSKVPNANVSLRKPVELTELIDNASNIKIANQLKEFRSLKKAFMWDFGIKATEYVSQDDEMYILCDNDIYWGKISGIITDESGKLSDAIGWKPIHGKPWQNVAIFENINSKLSLTTESIASIKCFASALSSDNILSKEFYRIHDSESFRRLVDNSQSSSYKTKTNSTTHHQAQRRDETLYEGWIAELDSRIKTLRENGSHKERANESLVEFLFSKLGYDQDSEIRYREGGVIDIALALEGELLMIIETKRDWNLSRSDKKVLLQAFGYAWDKGSRFVTITNGDYYGVWDLHKGKTYDAAFMFEFKISALNEDDLRNLKKLNKAFFCR